MVLKSEKLPEEDLMVLYCTSYGIFITYLNDIVMHGNYFITGRNYWIKRKQEEFIFECETKHLHLAFTFLHSISIFINIYI